MNIQIASWRSFFLNLTQLVGLIAADKESKRLGEIIRVIKLPHKLTKIRVPHVVILVQNFLKKDAEVPILVDKIVKVKGEYAWFDIVKKDFNEEVKFYRKQNQRNFAAYEELQDYAINLRHNYYFENKSPLLRRQEKRKE